MALPYTVEVLEHCHVSPPPNSIPPTSLPLTFFDIPMFLSPAVQRIFFYEFPHSTLHFTNTILPTLKSSLSLALQYFFPLAGTLTYPPHPSQPHILCSDGDSVPLTIAESTGDFAHLLTNCCRDVREFHPFVPHLPPACVSNDTHPLLALQLTVFPNSGICIGITYLHVVADGSSCMHFVKSWASIFRSGGDPSCIEKSLPFYDRSVIKPPEDLDSIFTNNSWLWRTQLAKFPRQIEDNFRATFVMGRPDIERLKQWISTKSKNHKESQDSRPLHLSTFVVTYAFIWVCLIKSKHSVTSDNKSVDDEKLHHFGFVADCRNRREFCVPTTYLGNCLAVCYSSVKRGDLMGENGVVVAAKTIGSKVKELDSGVLRKAEKWIVDRSGWSEVEDFVSVAGSPKLRVYETDFGWGKPRKCQVVHIDVAGTISLAECRDEEGGVEVGLALKRAQMETFTSIFEQGLKVLC